MPRLLWLADAAREAQLEVAEVSGWRERGSTSFNPKGIVCHHTAGASTGDMPSLRILTYGRSDLPGPLCNYGLGRSGKVYVVAAGRANHAGSGGWQGLVGNSSVVGIEAENDGRQAWPSAQLEAYKRLCTVLTKKLSGNPKYCCGHKEWAPTRKPDPHSINMGEFRTSIANRIAPAPPVTPSHSITVTSISEIDMQLARIHVAIPLDPSGKGWVSIPYHIDNIIGFLPHSEVRPGVDNRYDDPANSVTFTPDGTSTVVVVQSGNPNGQAHIWLRVAS